MLWTQLLKTISQKLLKIVWLDKYFLVAYIGNFDMLIWTEFKSSLLQVHEKTLPIGFALLEYSYICGRGTWARLLLLRIPYWKYPQLVDKAFLSKPWSKWKKLLSFPENLYPPPPPILKIKMAVTISIFLLLFSHSSNLYMCFAFWMNWNDFFLVM